MSWATRAVCSPYALLLLMLPCTPESLPYLAGVFAKSDARAPPARSLLLSTRALRAL